MQRFVTPALTAVVVMVIVYRVAFLRKNLLGIA